MTILGYQNSGQPGRMIPVVAAFRASSVSCSQLEVDCPFCGRVHTHWGGRTTGKGDGHRVAHCAERTEDSTVGYVLRELGLDERRPSERHLGAPRVAGARAIGPRLRAFVFERDGFRCRRCGWGADDGVRLVVDHIVAVANGGSAAPENLQTLCHDCNAGKSDRAPHPHDLRRRS